MNKEQLEAEIEKEYQSGWALPIGSKLQPAQPKKAQELAGFQIRNSYSKHEWTGCHGFATTKEAEKCNSEWRYVYTSPPELAEIERQLAEAQKDQARLAFMCTHSGYIACTMDGEMCNVWFAADRGEEERPAEGYPQKRYDDYRVAIDAAMKVKS